MGILMPMSILPKDRKIGTDVTEELNIKKYEPEEDASPKKKINSKVLCLSILNLLQNLFGAKNVPMKNSQHG